MNDQPHTVPSRLSNCSSAASLSHNKDPLSVDNLSVEFETYLLRSLWRKNCIFTFVSRLSCSRLHAFYHCRRAHSTMYMERYVCSGTLRRGSLQLFVIYSFPCFRDVGVCAHPQAEVSDLQDIYRQEYICKLI